MAILFWRQVWKIHPYVKIRQVAGGSDGDDSVAEAPRLVAGRGWARRKPKRGRLLFHGAIIAGALTVVGSLILLCAVSPVAGAAVLVAILLSCLLLVVRKATAHGFLRGPPLRRSDRPVKSRAAGEGKARVPGRE
jgi:hypothetical protein